MIKINLLPPEIVAERSRKAAQTRVMKLASVLTVVLIAGFGGLLALTLQVRGQVKDTVDARTAVEAEIAQYAQYQEMQNSITEKSTLVKTAMGSPLMWRDTLGALGIHIPGNVWLSNVSVTYDGEKGAMVLRGLTYDHPSAANWVDALQEIPGINDVRVSYSSEEAVESQDLVRFEINATVSAGEEYDPLAERGE